MTTCILAHYYSSLCHHRFKSCLPSKVPLEMMQRRPPLAISGTCQSRYHNQKMDKHMYHSRRKAERTERPEKAYRKAGCCDAVLRPGRHSPPESPKCNPSGSIDVPSAAARRKSDNGAVAPARRVREILCQPHD